MQKLSFSIILVLLFFNRSGYSQYHISGYINTSGEKKTVYLSMLKYDEENAIYPGQVLLAVQTDGSGYFEITGKLLPKESMLYRIHTNPDEHDTQLTFIESGAKKNYHNFIFSNTDTIVFPKGNDIMFGCPQNTNRDDAEWQKILRYEMKLLNEYNENQNSDAKKYAERYFIDEFKLFCRDSLKKPLVRLLAYSHLKRNVNKLEDDFILDPDFYNTLLNDLHKYYSETAYYQQYQEEILKLSGLGIQEKYAFHKKLNYLLAGIILTLLSTILILIRKLKKTRIIASETGVFDLTEQERKIAKLICDGMSNKEISSHLFISVSTVKSHIGSINSKLSVCNRPQLIEKLKIHTGY